MTADSEKALTVEEIIPNSNSLVVLSARGYLKRMPEDTFTAQARPLRLCVACSWRSNA